MSRIAKYEPIICPSCKSIEVAQVEEEIPFFIWLHTCKKCEYIITESDWQPLPNLEDFKVWLIADGVDLSGDKNGIYNEIPEDKKKYLGKFNVDTITRLSEMIKGLGYNPDKCIIEAEEPFL